MKKSLSSLGLMAMTTMLAIALMVPAVASAQVANTSVPRTVSVYGDAKVSVKPDRAILSVQIEGTAANSLEGQEKRRNDLSTIMAALEKAGIQDAKVRTSWYNSYPQYDYSETSAGIVSKEKMAGGGGIMPVDSSAKILGYTSSHSVSVNVPFAHLDKAYAALEKITELGMLTVQYVNVSVDNPEMHLDQARQDAAANARARAEKWASIFDARVGKVMSITDYNTYSYYGGEFSYQYTYSSNPAEDMNVELSVQVQVVFEML